MANTFNFEKFSKSYAILNAQKVDIENKMQILKAKLKDNVNKLDNRKVETKYTTMYFKKGYTRKVVDLKKLEAENPKLYKQLQQGGFIKETPIDESFDIKCKTVLVETTITTTIK